MPKVNIGDINMFYRIFVNDKEHAGVDHSKPVMIVHHGGMGSVDHQIELEPWKLFSHKVQVIYIDQRGCGQTDDGDPNLWTMDQFGDDVFNFSNALGIQKPILTGVSSGGYANIACATRHPEFPDALILLNTEPVVSPEAKATAYRAQGRRDDRREFAPFKELSDADIIAYAEEAAKAVLAYDEDSSPEALEKFMEYGFSTISKKPYSPAAPFRFNEGMKKVFANGFGKFDYMADMSNITCPTLWLAGEYDPLHPYPGAQAGAKRISGKCTLHVLDTGAPIYHDLPDAFYKLTHDFLDTQLALKEKTDEEYDAGLRFGMSY